jgi:8-amino-7-oxononanoate synthase
MPADSPLGQRTRQHLADLQSRDLERTMRPPAGIDLSSNDYLGLASDPRVRAAFARGIERDGVGSTGSRLLRGHRDAFAAVERQFAAFKGTDRALFFSSGYLANLAVLTTFGEAGDVIYSDARNHASLIDASRLARARVVIAPHSDTTALETMLRDEAGEGLALVAIESMYSMDGDVAPLAELQALCARYGATLVVDEAHAVGVRGVRGTGLIEEAGLDPNSCLSINTAGKALGVGGAFVAGPAWAIEYLVQRARSFVFSTAAPPAMAHALAESLRIVAAEPETRATLRARARAFRRALRALGLDVDDTDSHIVPIVVGENARALAVAAALQAEGFDVRAIRPPTVPPGTARLRVSLNAAVAADVLDRLVTALAAALREHAATADV